MKQKGTLLLMIAAFGFLWYGLWKWLQHYYERHYYRGLRDSLLNFQHITSSEHQV